MGRESCVMTSRERVLSAFERKGYDRIPVKHEGTPEINAMLLAHFGLANKEQLLRVLGDDFRYVEATYAGPPLQKFEDGSFEGWFGARFKWVDFGHGRYLESIALPYAGVHSLEQLDRTRFTRAEWFEYSEIKAQCEALNGCYAICFGTPGDLSFINGIGRYRGQEQVLMDIIDRDPVYLELLKARFEFYYNLHRSALKAAEGLIDFVHVGEDLGDQRGPVIDPQLFEELFVPLYKKHFAMVHSFGARTMMHMCGSVSAFLPRLIEIGLDVFDVVQPTSPDMDIGALKRNFGDELVLCGSICVQTTLPRESEEHVCKEVRRRLKLFPNGGLFLGPTHAIQTGTPLENILALYRTAGSLTEKIDLSIRDIRERKESEINLFKLFG
jgi:uroporphyrinogen decarboxylase